MTTNFPEIPFDDGTDNFYDPHSIIYWFTRYCEYAGFVDKDKVWEATIDEIREMFSDEQLMEMCWSVLLWSIECKPISMMWVSPQKICDHVDVAISAGGELDDHMIALMEADEEFMAVLELHK